MVRTDEHAHIDTDLGNENRGDHPVDAGDLHQESMLCAVWLEPLRDARGERLDVVLGCFEPVQLDRWQEAMMLLELGPRGRAPARHACGAADPWRGQRFPRLRCCPRSMS